MDLIRGSRHYVFNNPLVWTDPSGYLGQKERQWLGALITIAATSTGNFWVAVGGGFVGGAVATQSLEGGLMGAFAAGVTAGIGLGGVDGCHRPMETDPLRTKLLTHL